MATGSVTDRNCCYQQSVAEILKIQNTSLAGGLSDPEVIERQGKFGPNKIDDVKRKSSWQIFFSQFKDLLILVLIAAAFIASFLGEPQDTVAIIALVILNATLGFSQEYRAERAMAALKELSSPNAKVKRNGLTSIIPSTELVNGDIVLLEAGNIVPADLRILESFQIYIDESTLTGESRPVEKINHPIITELLLPIADQKNMAFKGTLVTGGRASAVVVNIGMTTELGKIAGLLKNAEELKTPLQNKIAHFAKTLSLIVLALCFIIFIIGLIRGEEIVLMFMTALSLAVAGIPEALPAVVTISLSLGSKVMSKKKSLVRKLTAVEALGSVTYICSDKTGTLTENHMQAGSFFVKGQKSLSIPENVLSDFSWENIIRAAALNNDVTIGDKDQLIGDPTEIALINLAIEQGLEIKSLQKMLPRLAELPFSSERAMMSTIHSNKEGSIIYSKGAPEKILSLCNRTYNPDGSNNIITLNKESQLQASHEMASLGFRVIAFGCRSLEKKATEIELSEVEKDLVFLGLIGLIDPPRKEACEAIKLCRSAGIQVVMITGDHPSTAKAIALNLGIISRPSEKVIIGIELQNTSDEDLLKIVKETRVYARVAPEQKIRIVKALQSSGEIVAMTGDGVNDAPALKKADVGIAMGKGGTDVAREASHIVLLDDNFATIVAAVKEGRRIYDNIRKFVRFALSGNSGEIWTLFLAPFVGLPIPLLPIQILWVNLITDGLPGLALALEPEEKDIMRRPPRKPSENIFAQGLWQHTVWAGLLIASVTLGTLAWAYYSGHIHWQSMAFTVLTFVQMGHVLAIRSETESFFTLGARTNFPLLLTVIFTLLLQLATLYIPVFQKIFKTQALTMSELLICILVSSIVFIAVEIEKWILRRNKKKAGH
jgi:Ca2+-transporting ATPase